MFYLDFKTQKSWFKPLGVHQGSFYPTCAKCFENERKRSVIAHFPLKLKQIIIYLSINQIDAAIDVAT